MTPPMDVQNKGEEVFRRRLGEAYNLFNFIEYWQRYSIKNYQIIKNNLDDTLDVRIK